MRSEDRSRVVVIGVWFGAFVIASVLGLWALASALLAIGVLGVAAYPVVVRIRERRFDLLEPIVGGTLALGIIFGLRPIAMLMVGDVSYRGTDTSPEFQYVIGLGLLGTIAFVGTYEWVRRRQGVSGPALQPPAVERRVAYAYVITLAALSVALFLLHLSRLGTDVVDGFRLATGGVRP